MNNTQWLGIRAFIAVAEHGSFTRASEATGISKASLSQHVSSLEERLGVQLLFRTTRKLRLSELGHEYFRRCKDAIQSLEQTQDWASQATDQLVGPIQLNAVGGVIGEQVLAPLLIEFQLQYPDIQIALDFSSLKVDLLTSEHDLVLRMGQLPDSSLVARRLHLIRTHYVASPGFLEKYGSVAHPRDLHSVPLIYGSVNEWHLRRCNEVERVQASGFQIGNGRVMLQAALAGLGVSRLADIYVHASLQQGSLVDVLSDWHETTPLNLLCPPMRHQLFRVRTLMDWLVIHFPQRYQEMMELGEFR